MQTLHVMLVAGCRPNFVKVATLMAAIDGRARSFAQPEAVAR